MSGCFFLKHGVFSDAYTCAALQGHDRQHCRLSDHLVVLAMWR